MTERQETPDILGSSTSTDQTAPAKPATPAAPIASAPSFRTERAPRTATPRQTQWEYLVVSFHEQNGWHARFINGRELDNWQRGPQLHDVLDQLGEDGWELINVVKGEALYGTLDRIQAFFKRPR